VDPATVTALVTAIQSVGLGNMLVVIVLAWGYRIVSASAGAVGRFLADALVTVGKLADKGIDVRLSVKVVDDNGTCVMPPEWGRGRGGGAPAQEEPRPEPRQVPPVSEVLRDPEPSGTWSAVALQQAAAPAK
jgi:hypothetical protein